MMMYDVYNLISIVYVIYIYNHIYIYLYDLKDMRWVSGCGVPPGGRDRGVEALLLQGARHPEGRG